MGQDDKPSFSTVAAEILTPNVGTLKMIVCQS